MSGKSAAIVALELYNEPQLAKRLATQPLHDGILPLIKIVTGDDTELPVFPSHIAANAEKARAIAVFYLQQVLFHHTSSGYRLLGLPPNASPEQLRDHKRCLLKWLHPDRNQNKWEQLYFMRVMDALKAVEQGEVPATPTPVPHTKRHVQRVRRVSRVKQPPITLINRPKSERFVWARIKYRSKQLTLLATAGCATYFLVNYFAGSDQLSHSLSYLAGVFQ